MTRGVLALGAAMFMTMAPGCSSKKAPDKNQPPATAKPSPVGAKKFPRLFRAKISQVVVSWGKHTIAIDRAQPRWRVTTPFKDNADPRLIEAVLRELERLELGHQPVSTDRAAWPSYKLAAGDVVTLLITHDGIKLPALHIGAKDYARIGDGADVYTRLHMNRYTWSRPPSAWRDRKVLRFDAKAATALEAVDAKGRRVVAVRTAAPPATSKKHARAPDKWTLSKGKKIVGTLNQSIPSIIFRRLQTLHAIDLATTDMATAGLDKPTLTLLIHVGQKRHALRFGKLADKHVFANVSGDKRIWKLRAVDVKLVQRELSSWGKPL